MYTNCTPATPPPDMSWDYGFMPGNGTITAVYGSYTGTVSGGGVRSCAAATAKTLITDATAMAAALQNLTSRWASDPNAAALEALIGDYAAGEIGAAAFIAGVISLDATAAVLAAATIGIALWSLAEMANCLTDGGIAYQAPVRRRSLA